MKGSKILTGLNSGKYPGAFPKQVEDTIRKIVGSASCLHLFSGASTLGNVRVDLEHPNATIHKNVYEFILEDKRIWDFVVLDPDYHISRKHLKLKPHALTDSVSGNVLAQRLLTKFFQGHVKNVVWFDLCAPNPPGFYRHDWWVYLQGGFHHVRFLSWLKRQGEFIVNRQEQTNER